MSHILAKFKHYIAGTAAIDRLLSHINKNDVKPAANESDSRVKLDLGGTATDN